MDAEIERWLEEELSNLSNDEVHVESLASKELEKLKDFLSPDIYSSLLPNSSRVKQESNSSEATSSNPITSTCISERFGKAITDSELSTTIEKRVPTNTKKTTNWGLNIWRECCQCRGIDQPIEHMPDKDINSLMARFVHEVKRRDGKDYPANSLNNIVSAIQRHLRESGRPEVNFYDKNNASFDLLRKSLDIRMKTLTANGVGIIKKKAQPITPEMENILWEKGIFSCKTSRGLLNVVFWYSCKLFGLRAADEHKRLEVNQFIFGDDEGGHFMRFVGKSCKNWQGGTPSGKD